MNEFRLLKMCVFKPYVSRLIPGYFLSVMLLLISCKQNNEQNADEIRIAKTVKPVYIKISDPDLYKHNDTIYYQGHFFTGFSYSLFPSGDTASIQSYFDGVEEGLQKKWFENMQLAEERFYINGKKQGSHRGWWPDGKLKFSFIAKDDEYDGEFKEWYSSGLLGKDFHYLNGHEEGSQRLWWDNGTVRANYVIKQGRKYGLIGLKTCINPYDSIYKK